MYNYLKTRSIYQFIGLVLLCITSTVDAQNTIRGRVTDAENKPVPYINVMAQSINKGAVTDADGAFMISNIAPGNYEITVSGIGFETQTLTSSVPGPALTVTLNEKDHELDEIVIQGKSDTQLAIEQPFKTEVINTKALAHQPSTMIELMNRSVGVRVRQTGGLGSSASISVNGFQDNAIKYFKDGIPMDYLGAGFNFAFVPVNMLERLEIYKGVLPVSLGADALGGALNLVTKEPSRKYVEASYELASYNTHRASLNLFTGNPERKYFIGTNAFFNYSDNNYEVLAPVVNEQTSNKEPTEVRLFHAAFKQYYGEVYGGLKNTRWADELRFSLTGFWIHRDNQYGSQLITPIGQAFSRQYSVVPTVRYRKRFLDNRLSVDQFLVANTLHVETVDTARGTYDWYGNFRPRDGRFGEMSTRGSLADIRYSILTSRTYVSYALHKNHKLEFNTVLTKLKRLGTDPRGITFDDTETDVLKAPAHYDKWVSALGVESNFFNDRVSNNLVAKFYRYSTDASDADWSGNRQHHAVSRTRWGIANAVKIAINDQSFVRLSGEAATRLPEQEEIFGDGNKHLANFELKAERSLNVNAGYRLSKINKYAFEFNAFYRITRDRILRESYNIMYTQNQNIENVKGTGFESDVTVNILPWLKANVNFTYQDFRIFNSKYKTIEGARLKNTPFFFANAGLNALRENLFQENDRIQAYWFYTFVRQFYLDFLPKELEPDGFLGLWGDAKIQAPNIIPDQHLHTIGFTYFPVGDTFSCGGEIKNILDARVYDNFKIQNMGRSFHFKLTYTLK